MDQGMGISIWQLIAIFVYAAIIILPIWKITTKAGYAGWLSLLMIIPLVNLIYLYFLGFSNWPSLRKVA